MNITKKQIINIQAYKHNGMLYRQWNGIKVIETSWKYWVLVSNKTKVIENKGQKWTTKEPVIWFFPLNKEFFNIIISIRKNGINYYINIASPPIFEDNAIKFIDYDIDVKLYPGKKIKIMDKWEYEINKEKFNYSLQLRKKITTTITALFKMIKNKKDYFNHNLIIFYLKKLVKSKDLAEEVLRKNYNIEK